jgi:hypothetical protein
MEKVDNITHFIIDEKTRRKKERKKMHRGGLQQFEKQKITNMHALRRRILIADPL